MKKKFGAIAISLLLLLQLMVPAAFAAGLSNFQTVRTYPAGKFTDVPDSQWYTQSVQKSYELGLFDGKSSSIFDPDGNITIGETIKLAACLNSIYQNGTTDFNTNASPWYRPYVDYALAEGIIKSEYADYNKEATRAEFAVIFDAALPDEALPTINTVDDNAIPDVSMYSTYASAVYKLYRAGILIGSNSLGAFEPQKEITRSSVAAIVTRMALPNLRQSITLTNEVFSGEEIFANCSPSVFYIEVYDTSGKAYGSGSGFFLSSNGLAVTNHHVIEDAASAMIRTSDGKTYKVEGIYDSSDSLDLALLKIEGSGFPYLTQGDSQSLKSGAKIYTIGSPLGLENTISEGIISSPSRVINGRTYIQITAPISEGSSGGALLDQSGKAIGVTTASLVNGQSINLAVPIHLVDQLSQSTLKPLGSITPSPSVSTVQVSPSSVSLTVGGSQAVTVSVDSDNWTSVRYRINNTSIVSAAWGDWNSTETQVPLTLTGKAPGSTTVTIQLYNENTDTVLASTTLTVTVTASSTTQYYSGYAPVPDYGAFMGVSSYMEYYDSGTDMMAYYYRASDVVYDTDKAINGYVDLLIANGFRLYHSFVDSDGYTVLVYRHNGQEILVYFGMAELGNTVCICIMIGPVP